MRINQGGVDQGASVASVSRLDQPPLNDNPGVELDSLGHGIHEYRSVLGDCAEVWRRFNLNE